MKFEKKLIIYIVLIILLGFLVKPSFAADQFKWKAQCWVGVTDLAWKSFQRFCNNVNKATNGRLEITPLPAGAVVPAYQMLDAVKSNAIQAMLGGPIYWSGKEPAFALLGDPNGAWRNFQEAEAYFLNYGGLELLKETYRPFNVYPVGVISPGMEVIPSNKCISKVEDFKGIKIRTPHGIPAEFFKRMGASPTILPGSEIYSALEKGIIDATDWSTPSTNYRMGIWEVTKYFNWPGFHSMSTGDFSVNLNEWDKLPDDIKAILELAVRDMAWDIVETAAVDNVVAIKEMKAKGIEVCYWSEEELNKARKIAQGVWEDWSKKNDQSKKVYESLISYLKLIGSIE